MLIAITYIYTYLFLFVFIHAIFDPPKIMQNHVQKNILYTSHDSLIILYIMLHRDTPGVYGLGSVRHGSVWTVWGYGQCFLEMIVLLCQLAKRNSFAQVGKHPSTQN